MGGFVRPHGGTKTSKGRDRKIMFLWWAGLPKVEKWPFWDFAICKIDFLTPILGILWPKMGENVYFHV